MDDNSTAQRSKLIERIQAMTPEQSELFLIAVYVFEERHPDWDERYSRLTRWLDSLDQGRLTHSDRKRLYIVALNNEPFPADLAHCLKEGVDVNDIS